MPEEVIKFPIDDGPFKAFLELYEKFQDAVKRLPDEWEKVNSGIEQGSVRLDHVLAGLLGQNEILNETLKVHERIAKIEEDREQRSKEDREAAKKLAEQREMESHAKAQTQYWRDMANHAGHFALQIKDATVWLLKWSTITGVISGLLGGGGLFGIARLAGSAAQGRQSSLGLGIPYGQQQAFSVNMGRFLGGEGGAQSFLGNVQESMTDVTHRSALYSLGITEQMMKGKNTAEVGAMVLDHIRNFAVQNKGSPAFANMFQARQYDQFMTSQQAQLLGNTGQGEFNQQMAGLRRDQGNMGVADERLRKWQDLDTQLERAGETIKSVLIDGLTKLTPEIGDLSKGVTDLVKGLVSGENGKQNVQMLTDGLHWLSSEINSSEFRQNVQDFVNTIGKLARAVGGAIGWLLKDKPHGDLSIGGGTSEPSQKDIDDGLKFWKDLIGKYLPSGGSSGGFGGGIGGGYNGMVTPVGFSPSGAWGGGGGPSRFASIEARHGLPPGLLARLHGVEGNGVSKAGAMGPFQFMQKTWNRFGGGGDVWNEGQAAEGAGNYLEYLMKFFHGNMEEALAGYNAGEERVAKALEKASRTGKDWRTFLPMETQDYIRKFGYGTQQQMTMRGRGANVAISVHNSTGGSAVTAARMLA